MQVESSERAKVKEKKVERRRKRTSERRVRARTRDKGEMSE